MEGEMGDMREKQPPVREFTPMTAANYEVELSAWPYSTIKSEDVISRKLIYRIHAADFSAAGKFAAVLCETVQAMHDIWTAKIVRIQECGL
jgi:hypothetical protein